MQTVAAPRRQLERGAYARGEQTRSRIVASALRIFGERGYDQTSTRTIAAAAGVTPPALQYYFGGKEGLHRACAQFIIDRALQALAPAFAQAERAIASRSRSAARAALRGILDTLTDALMTAGSDSWSRFVTRGKLDGAGPAMPMIRERVGLPLIDRTAQLIGVLQDENASHPLNRLRALILLAPINWIHANREGVLTVLGWRSFSDQRLDLLKGMLPIQARTPTRRRRQRADTPI
jgi:AcrR family transcriptional regulator